jgi:CopG antitoxin of type II toxin-antitoxin system
MTDEYDESKLEPYEPIPEFKSRQEEAEFWDTHDLADYWREFKTVKVRFAKNLSAKNLPERRKRRPKTTAKLPPAAGDTASN